MHYSLQDREHTPFSPENQPRGAAARDPKEAVSGLNPGDAQGKGSCSSGLFLPKANSGAALCLLSLLLAGLSYYPCNHILKVKNKYM